LIVKLSEEKSCFPKIRGDQRRDQIGDERGDQRVERDADDEGTASSTRLPRRRNVRNSLATDCIGAPSPSGARRYCVRILSASASAWRLNS